MISEEDGKIVWIMIIGFVFFMIHLWNQNDLEDRPR